MKNITKQLGFNLIELMITITLGSFLILGASFAFQEAQKTYIVNDSVARLFENAQYVLDVLEEDIRLSSYWGLHNKRASIEGDSNAAIGAALTGISGDCDEEWALDLRFGISGTNGPETPASALTAAATRPNWADATNCLGDYRSNTDTLIVRHADYDIIPDSDLEVGQMYIRSHEASQTQLFTGTTAPATNPGAQTYEYLAHGYYVTNNSYTANDGIPMLRRMALVDDGTTPAVESQEIISGVEDFQIQFGVDYQQRGDVGYGSIDQYVNPDNGALARPSTRVLTVRIWALLRGQDPEPSFTNTSTYTYGNVAAYTVNDNFRRLLVSKTIQVRNMEVE